MTTATPNDIRDIKPPIPIPNEWTPLWWAVAAITVLAALFVAWRAWRRRRARVPIVPPVPSHVRARQMLEKALQFIGQPKPFCTLVSHAIRVYLEQRFDFRAPERTTEEFLRELTRTDRLTPGQKQSLAQFLESCDLVKFAKYEPRENELLALHQSALQLVDETEPKGMEGPAAPAAPAAPTAVPPPLPAEVSNS
ncbi:MAG: hypothetical protein KGR98_04735 [Verrucomicrobia bacterium]|nr:hypothetical protein [Verrucomicrobiota bacterium]MDE3098498.1 hypothetical protein [Verrucomicrobiota bacterium]